MRGWINLTRSESPIKRQCRDSPFDLRHHLLVFHSFGAAKAAFEFSLLHGFRQIGSVWHEVFFA